MQNGDGIVSRTKVQDEVRNEGSGAADNENEDGKMNRDNYHGPVTIYVDRKEGRPIRFRTKSVCIR